MVELVASPAAAGLRPRPRRDTLPRLLPELRRSASPATASARKNRFTTTPDGEPGLNYLCAGYKSFFTHIDGPMRLMAGLLRRGHYADEILDVFAGAGRNDPCPCGSGRKAKACHQAPVAV